MFLFIYTLLLIYFVYNLGKYITTNAKKTDQNNLPQLLLSILLYNKLLSSMQIIAAFVFLATISPFNLYFILPQYKVIVYHIILFIGLLIKDVKTDILGKLSNHTYLINFFMFLDTLRVLN